MGTFNHKVSHSEQDTLHFFHGERAPKFRTDHSKGGSHPWIRDFTQPSRLWTTVYILRRDICATVVVCTKQEVVPEAGLSLRANIFQFDRSSRSRRNSTEAIPIPNIALKTVLPISNNTSK